MNLPKLYKRTVTRAIQEWQIFFADGEYYTVSGQTDGKKVTSTPTVCKGKNLGKKNETTNEEQAELEAKAKWQKKKDEGYIENIEAVDGAMDFRFNPMLAKDYANYEDKIAFPVYSQPKLDGLRCVITREGTFSRQWKPFVTLDYVQDVLRAVFDQNPGLLAFDGEMYSHELKDRFEEIVSIVKQPKATAEDLEKCKNNIQYHVYDAVFEEAHSFSARINAVTMLLRELDSPYIKLVETDRIRNQDDLDAMYQQYMQEGYEGQMIRTPLSLYQHNRTKDLLKRKDFHDAEYEIIGYKEGKGSREGCIILRLGMADGTEFDSVPVGGVEYLQRLWLRREDLLGLRATVKYQNLSNDGIPRFNNTVKIRNHKLEEMVF